MVTYSVLGYGFRRHRNTASGVGERLFAGAGYPGRAFLQVDLNVGKAGVGEKFAMFLGGQELQADLCGLLFEKSGDRRICTLVDFCYQDEPTAGLDDAKDLAQVVG